jgi:hypothetical protein
VKTDESRPDPDGNNLHFSVLDSVVAAIQDAVIKKGGDTIHDLGNVTELLGYLQANSQDDMKEQRILLACMGRIAFFARSFAPYFDLLSICTEVKSEWASTMWRLVALVYQVSVNVQTIL